MPTILQIEQVGVKYLRLKTPTIAQRRVLPAGMMLDFRTYAAYAAHVQQDGRIPESQEIAV